LAKDPFNVGFLTVLHEANGYLGGYLVTNQWGRPLEFRLSTAVQPNRVQQILYAGTLQGYICADLIGKTLVEKTAVPAQLILTEPGAPLDLRLSRPGPVALVRPPERVEQGVALPALAGPPELAPRRGRATLATHPQFPADERTVEELIARLNG